MLRVLLPLLILVFSLPANGAEKRIHLNELEKMLNGFSTCKFEGVYIDWQTGKAVHPYLSKLAKSGMKIKDDFAYFNNIPKTFHGFKVLELIVPAQTWSVHQLVLDTPRQRARPILERALKTKLPPVSPLPEDSDDFVPLLREYPGKPNWSVLECVSSL